MHRTEPTGPVLHPAERQDDRSVRLLVVLATDPGGRPTGVVEDGTGRSTSFVGWLELMAELARPLANPSHPRPAP